jgi:hypothetical protein
LFWLESLGETRAGHQREVVPGPGDHKLILVDEHGEELVQPFTVLSKNKTATSP